MLVETQEKVYFLWNCKYYESFGPPMSLLLRSVSKLFKKNIVKPRYKEVQKADYNNYADAECISIRDPLRKGTSYRGEEVFIIRLIEC